MSHNPTVAEVFAARTQRAANLAAAIAEHMGNNMGADLEFIDWGYAGSAGRAVELLEELSKFLGLELPA